MRSGFYWLGAQLEPEFRARGIQVGSARADSGVSATLGAGVVERAHRPLTPTADFSCDEVIRERAC
jgi:hypothetical protein